MKRIITFLLLIIIGGTLTFKTLYAQTAPAFDNSKSSTTTLDIGNDAATGKPLTVKPNLQPITIPLFGNIGVGTPYDTIYSWASFIGNIATIGLVIFWVFLLIKAGVKRANAGSNAEIEAESFKQMKSALVGAGLSIAFPIVLTGIGFAVGAGAFWNWPKAFRSCPNDSKVTFYFQEVLKQKSSSSTSVADQENAAEIACYGTTSP